MWLPEFVCRAEHRYFIYLEVNFCFHINWKVHCTWLVISTLLLKVNVVTYAAKVVVSWKWCKIEILLQQITNRNWYVAYIIAAVESICWWPVVTTWRNLCVLYHFQDTITLQCKWLPVTLRSPSVRQLENCPWLMIEVRLTPLGFGSLRLWHLPLCLVPSLLVLDYGAKIMVTLVSLKGKVEADGQTEWQTEAIALLLVLIC